MKSFTTFYHPKLPSYLSYLQRSHPSVGVYCCLLAARGSANQWRICVTCDEFQQTTQSLPNSIMPKAFDSESFVLGSHSSSGAVVMYWVRKTSRCFFMVVWIMMNYFMKESLMGKKLVVLQSYWPFVQAGHRKPCTRVRWRCYLGKNN